MLGHALSNPRHERDSLGLLSLHHVLQVCALDPEMYFVIFGCLGYGNPRNKMYSVRIIVFPLHSSFRYFLLFAGLSGVARANEAFSPAFDAAYTSILQRKLGLSGMELGSGWMHPSRSGGGAAGATKDAQFVLEYFRLMSTCRVDFTDTWRALLDVPALSMTRKARRFSGGAVEGGEGRSDIGQGSGRDCASGTQEDDTWGNLRPLRSVLMAAGASGKQIREWAAWVHEYSSRIDTQGIGKFHPEGEAEGRRERLEIMRKSNPAFVLRAATLEQALKSAEIGGERREQCGYS